MKNIKCKIVLVLLILLTIILLASQVQAANFNPNDYKPNSTTDVTGAVQFQRYANTIIGTIQVVGSITSVIALVVMGIRYVLGSVEEKAEYKKTMKPYVIGAVMVFGITNILGIVPDIMRAF